MYGSIYQEDKANLPHGSVKFYSPTELSRICRKQPTNPRSPNEFPLPHRKLKSTETQEQRKHRRNRHFPEIPEENQRKERRERRRHRKEYQDVLMQPTYEQQIMMMHENQGDDKKERKHHHHKRHKVKEFCELNYQDLQCLINDYNRDMDSAVSDCNKENGRSHQRSRSIDQIPTRDIPSYQRSMKRHGSVRPKSAETNEAPSSGRTKESHQYFPHEEVIEEHHVLLSPNEDNIFFQNPSKRQHHRSKTKRKRRHHRTDNKMPEFVTIDQINEQTINLPNNEEYDPEELNRWQNDLRNSLRHNNNNPKISFEEYLQHQVLLNEQKEEQKQDADREKLIQNLQKIVDGNIDENGRKKRKEKDNRSNRKNKDESENGIDDLKKYLKKLSKEQEKESIILTVGDDRKSAAKQDERNYENRKMYGEVLQNIFHLTTKQPSLEGHAKEHVKKKTTKKHRKDYIPLDFGTEELEISPKTKRKHGLGKHKMRHEESSKKTNHKMKCPSISADRKERQEDLEKLFCANDDSFDFFNFNNDFSLKTKCKSECSLKSLLQKEKDLVYLYESKDDCLKKHSHSHGIASEVKAKKTIEDGFSEKPNENKKQLADVTLDIQKRKELFERAIRRDFQPRPRARLSRSRQRSSKTGNDKDEKPTKEVKSYDIGTCTILDNNFGEILELLKREPIVRSPSSDKKRSVFHVKKKLSREECVEVDKKAFYEKDNGIGIVVRGIEPAKKIEGSHAANSTLKFPSDGQKVNNLECKTLSVVSINPAKQVDHECVVTAHNALKTMTTPEEVSQPAQSSDKRQERLLKYYKVEGGDTTKNTTALKDRQKSFRDLITSKLGDYLKELQEDIDCRMLQLQTEGPKDPIIVKLILPIDCTSLQQSDCAAEKDDNVDDNNFPKESFSDLNINYSDTNELEDDFDYIYRKKSDQTIPLLSEDKAGVQDDKIMQQMDSFFAHLQNEYMNFPFRLVPNVGANKLQHQQMNYFKEFSSCSASENANFSSFAERSFSENIPMHLDFFRHMINNKDNNTGMVPLVDFQNQMNVFKNPCQPQNPKKTYQDTKESHKMENFFNSTQYQEQHILTDSKHKGQNNVLSSSQQHDIKKPVEPGLVQVLSKDMDVLKHEPPEQCIVNPSHEDIDKLKGVELVTEQQTIGLNICYQNVQETFRSNKNSQFEHKVTYDESSQSSLRTQFSSMHDSEHSQHSIASQLKQEYSALMQEDEKPLEQTYFTKGKPQSKKQEESLRCQQQQGKQFRDENPRAQTQQMNLKYEEDISSSQLPRKQKEEEAEDQKYQRKQTKLQYEDKNPSTLVTRNQCFEEESPKHQKKQTKCQYEEENPTRFEKEIPKHLRKPIKLQYVENNPTTLLPRKQSFERELLKLRKKQQINGESSRSQQKNSRVEDDEDTMSRCYNFFINSTKKSPSLNKANNNIEFHSSEDEETSQIEFLKFKAKIKDRKNKHIEESAVLRHFYNRKNYSNTEREDHKGHSINVYKHSPNNSFIPRRKVKVIESPKKKIWETSSSSLVDNNSEQTLTPGGAYEESYFNKSQDNSVWEYETVKERILKEDRINEKELDKSVKKCLAWKISNNPSVNEVMTKYTAKPVDRSKKVENKMYHSAKKSSIPVVRKETQKSTCALGKSVDTIPEARQTSLFLTKVFRAPPGQSSYERRKNYDSRIRRTIKRSKQAAKASPLIYEVRYCNVINQSTSNLPRVKSDQNMSSGDHICLFRRSKSFLSSDVSCDLKEGKYEEVDNGNVAELASKITDGEDEVSNKVSPEINNEHQSTKDKFLGEKKPKQQNETLRNTENISIKSYDIDKVKFKLDKPTNRNRQRSKIAVRCSKISKENGRRNPKFVAKVKNDKKRKILEKNDSNERQEEYYDCQDIMTKMSVEGVTDNDFCVFLESRRLSTVPSEPASECSTLNAILNDLELSENNHCSVDTVVNTPASASSIHSRETVKNFTEQEVREYKSTVDSGYLTKEAEVNGSISTIESGVRDAKTCCSCMEKTVNCSRWNEKGLVKLKNQLLFPNVYDDFEPLESAKNTELISYYVESVNDKLKRAIETTSNHEDNENTISTRSRSVISLSSEKVIPEEEPSTEISSSISSLRNEEGFNNYQKFVVLNNNENYNAEDLPPKIISKSGVCEDQKEPIRDPEYTKSNSETSIRSAISVTKSVSKSKSVIELFKLRPSSVKRSSSSIISTQENFEKEDMVCTLKNNILSDEEFLNNFHQIMSVECERYAKIVRDQANPSRDEKENEEFEELPLNYLLGLKGSNFRNSSKGPLVSEYQLASEDVSTSNKVSDSTAVSKEEIEEKSSESFKSVTCVAEKVKKDIRNCQFKEVKKNVSYCENTKPNFDFYSQEKVSILDMMKTSNISTPSSYSHQTCLPKGKKDILDFFPQGDLSKQSEKQFFDNLLAFYDRQSDFIKKLMRDDEFFVSLIDMIRNTDESTSPGCGEVARNSSKKEKKKGILSRIFRWKDKKSSETLMLETSMSKSMEFAKSISGGTVSVTKESFVSFIKDLEDLEKEMKEGEKSSVEIPNAEHIQQLAHRARCHLEPMVKASMTNRHISDKIKLAGFLKLLEMVENGDFTFLNSGDNRPLEEKLKEHVAQMFEKVYRIANREVIQKNAFLDFEKIQQLKILVTKYHMGIDTHIDILAIYIGRGLIDNRTQLEDAILYLMGLDAQEVNLERFEQYCGINTDIH